MHGRGLKLPALDQPKVYIESQPPKPGGVTALRRGSKEAWGLREENLSVEGWREPSGAGGQEGVAIPELNVGELQSPVPP